MSPDPHNVRLLPYVPVGRLALCAWLCFGPVLPVAAVPTAAGAAAPRPTVGASRMYRVKPGDTLRLIALRFYGSKRHWARVYHANRTTIGGNPDLIHSGAVLALPGQTRVAAPKASPLASALPLPPRLPKPEASPEPSILWPIAEVAPAPEPVPEPVVPTPIPTPEPLAVATISLPVTEPIVSPYLPAAASLLVPGSAQLARGDWDRGLSHLGLSGLALGATLVGNQSADPSLQWAGGIGLVGISLWSAWDAYRHAEAVTAP